MKNIFWALCISATLLGVSVTPLQRSVEPDHAMIRIDPTLMGANVIKFPLNIKMNVQGFPLGVISQLPRKNAFRGDPRGQAIHLFVDNLPYVDISNMPPLYVIKTAIPRGQHLIRVLLCRSFGECLKEEGAFDLSVFNVSDRKHKVLLDFDENAPLLTYNEPQGTFPEGAILLDFYLTNCTLAPDGYKIKLRIDHQEVRVLSEWVPYSIQGLSKGPHKIRLTLVDSEGTPVEGDFNDIEREIFVK